MNNQIEYFYNIENLNDFEISYDRERNYRDFSNPNYIPPYDSYRYDSIYQGNILEIHVVNHCNLNCGGCNHFAPLAEEWYIDENSFREQLTLAKKHIPNIGKLIILGGEPTLHPKIFELAKIAREIFSDLNIDVGIYTNGIELEHIANRIQDFKNINVGFSICSYPGLSNDKDINIILDNGMGYFSGARTFMNQTLVNENGDEDFINNFFNCYKHQIPCLTLKDYKLYICPFSAHVEHYFKKRGLENPLCELDYIDIRDLEENLDNLQTFCFTPKPICAYCHHGGEVVPWHKSFKDTIEYQKDLYELYFKDYQRYEQIINSGRDIMSKAFDDNFNPTMKIHYHGHEQRDRFLNRYGKGKIDIIIPYYNLNSGQRKSLYNDLKMQTIIKDCVIYLVSDNSPDEEQVIKTFMGDPDLNCIFLKTEKRNGPGVARNKGYKNSYNDFVIFLDADDGIIDSTALERLYNLLLENPTKDLINFTMYSDEVEHFSQGIKPNYLLKRHFLDEYNIDFPAYYFGEDYLFMKKIYACKYGNNLINIPSDSKVRKNAFLVYKIENNPNCLTQEFIKKKDYIALNLIISRILYYIWLKENNLITKDHITDILLNLNNFLIKNIHNEYIKVLIYYFEYIIFIECRELNIEKAFPQNYYLDFLNNNFIITTKNNILKSPNEALSYLMNNIIQYQDNEYFYKIISDYINLFLNGQKN